MREILFRGKRTDNGEGWKYGYFFKSWDNCYILHGTVNGVPVMVEVVPETIGQFTGLKDKNGIKIFEGDICVHSDKGNYPRPLVVEWIEDYMCFSFVDVNDYHKNYFFQKQDMDNIKVIGNIHDNKYLLK